MRFFIFLFLAAIATSAQQPNTKPFDYLAFKNGHWWNGGAFSARDFYSVNGVLHPNPMPTDAEVVDLKGGWVLPACADSHNHAAQGEQPQALQRFIDEGILFVRNPENVPGTRTGPLINTPMGVDVTFANGALTSSEGHPLILVRRGAVPATEGEGRFYYTIDSLADAETKLPKLFSTHPDFVKLILVYSEDFQKRRFDPANKDKDPYFSRRGLNPSLVPALVKMVHAKGLSVVAHVESAYDFHVAVSAGADSIAHMPGFWPDPDSIKSGDYSRYKIVDADARTAAKHGTDVTTTLWESLTTQQITEEIRSKLILVYRANLATLKKHHVKLLIGSDQFKTTSREEVIAIANAGLLSKPELLKAWCETTPKALFPERKIGKLADGYETDIVVLRENPLEDIRAVSQVEAVFKQGKRLSVQSTER